MLLTFAILFGLNQINYSQAKETTIDSLITQTDNLQDSISSKNIELEKLKRKIKLLEGENSFTFSNRDKWRKLERYMSIKEVEHLLGEPTSIDESASSTRYWYGNGFINFNAFKKVSDWSEPRKNRIEIIEH